MDDETAIDGLKRLGLTTYQARVFLALQKLGSGTASEISDVADVPRSQVYGAAEELDARGLLEIQQSTPTVYRPVPLGRARTHLLDQLAETGSETFDYLETVQSTEEETERTESIWMIHGHEAVNSRGADLIRRAETRVLYATDVPETLSEEVLEAMEAAGERGVTVVLASIDEAVLDRAPDADWLVTYHVPPSRDLDVDIGRLLFADDETILLSTHSRNGDGEDAAEVAFWTSENAFAAVLGELAAAWMQDPFQ